MTLRELKTKILGRNLVFYPEIDSTQLEAWRRIEKGKVENGTVILADRQTKGRRDTWEKMVYRRRK